MLKLTKTNLVQHQNKVIQTQQQTQIDEKESGQYILDQLLRQKSCSNQQIFNFLHNQSSSSVSGSQFVKILQFVLHENNLQDGQIKSSFLVLQSLISTSHDSKQVRQQLKKSKSIDPLLILSILWNLRQDLNCWKYVSYVIQSYPTEIIINGKQYIRKWQQYFSEYQQKIKLNAELKQQIHQNQLKQKLGKQLQNSKETGFVDTYINL